MSPQDSIFVCSLLVHLFIICKNSITAERTITVDRNNCGGSIDIDIIQKLYLNYNGVELGKKYCLYNVTSFNMNPELELCIYYHDHEVWDISCGSSVKLHIGKYYGYNIPSRHHCSSFDPLCTSEKKMFLEFQYDRALHIMGLDVNLKFDIFTRLKPETTTERILTTRLPSISSNSKGKADFSITWIVLISIGGVMGLIFCAAFWYGCCSKDDADETRGQGNRPAEGQDQGTGESMRMMETPVVHVPPENIQPNWSDPPDYDTVCSSDVQLNDYSKGHRDKQVVPSAPLQPSAPPPDAPPPRYPGIY